MSVFNVKKYKVAKRLGAGVYEKTQTQKFMLSQSRGAKRGKRPKRPTDYGKQLIEKQKVRFMYGVRERQFGNYIKEATQKSGGITPAQKLFTLLERRLDNTVFRLGVAHTRGMARQMVSHGHFLVNGKKTTIPSYRLQEGDVIEIRPGSADRACFAELDKKIKNHTMPAWLNWESKKSKGQVKGEPKDPDAFLDFQAVIEFYSR